MLTVAAAGLALLATACGEDPEAPTSEPAQVGKAVVWAPPDLDERYGMPEIGACQRLPRDTSGGSDVQVETVPCSEPHTSRTYLVDVIPTHVADDPQQWVAARCTDAFAEAIGLPPRQIPGAFVEWVWLQPDAKMRDHGARWYRCDVRANRPGADVDLPGTTLPLFTEDIPDEWLRCVDVSDDAAAYVSCDRPHQFRWAGSVEVADGPHPSRAEWEELAGKNCRSIVGPEAFWFTYPNHVQWRDGDHRLSCYRKV